MGSFWTDAAADAVTAPVAAGVRVLGPPHGPTARAARGLLARFGLSLAWTAPGAPIPGSYWGAPEAGLSGARLSARGDTPLHSLLHEACHYACMDPDRRAALDTDAGGDPLEECAVCYLSILLADHLPRFGRARMLADMDAWGYGFRLGSARAWFENDAGDARAWLATHGLTAADDTVRFRVRGGGAHGA